MQDSATDISSFFLAGINYRKSEAAVRGQFAINTDQYAAILQKAAAKGIHELFILSTCNRTEIYGIVDNPDTLITLLCSQTSGGAEQFKQLAYIKKGKEAIHHIFNVAAGLDSQILGDYEIVGQIKAAVKFSRENGFIKNFLERLTNSVLQASKQIKNETALSSGTVSVSFAAVHYIREKTENISRKNILLIGTGKIGRNTCKNLADYVTANAITLCNRTEEKAIALADELGLQYAPMQKLEESIDTADIILVATNATEPVILSSHLKNGKKKLIIDLSVPANVGKSAQQLPGITFVNVDELSKLKDETLTRRQAEVPKAQYIIAEHIADFTEWYNMRKYVPVLKAVKTKLEAMQSCSLYSTTYQSFPPSSKIQQVVSGMATKMRRQNHKGCYYIEAINEFIATGSD